MLEQHPASSEKQADDIVELVEIVCEQDETDRDEEATSSAHSPQPSLAASYVPLPETLNLTKKYAAEPSAMPPLISDTDPLPQEQERRGSIPSLDARTSSLGEYSTSVQTALPFPDGESSSFPQKDFASSRMQAPSRDPQIIALENQISILTAELTELQLSFASLTKQETQPVTLDNLHSELNIREERLSRHLEAEIDEYIKDISPLEDRMTQLEQSLMTRIEALEKSTSSGESEVPPSLNETRIQPLLVLLRPAIERIAAHSAAQALREELALLLAHKSI